MATDGGGGAVMAMDHSQLLYTGPIALYDLLLYLQFTSSRLSTHSLSHHSRLYRAVDSLAQLLCIICHATAWPVPVAVQQSVVSSCATDWHISKAVVQEQWVYEIRIYVHTQHRCFYHVLLNRHHGFLHLFKAEKLDVYCE